MLWRVGQGRRQFHQAAVALFTSYRPFTYPSLLIVQALHQSIATPWPSAAARPRLSYDSAPTRSGNVSQELRRGKKVHGGMLKKTKNTPDLKFPVMLDRLFFRGEMKPDALHKLRDTNSLSPLREHLSDRVKAATLAIYMTGTLCPQRALQVLILAHTLGCKFKHTAYECVARGLAQGHHWHLIPVLIDLGKQHTGRTSVRLLNWWALSLIQTRNFALFDRVPERFNQEGLCPNRRTFHLLISGHLRNRDLFKAQEFLADMENAGFPIDVSTHTLIVSVYRSLGADPVVIAKATEVLPQAEGRLGTVIHNSLIQFALESHDMPGALQLLSTGPSRPYRQNHPLSHGGGTIPDGGETLTSPPESDGKQSLHRAPPSSALPTSFHDAATFTMLINYLAKEGDLPRAIGVLHRMEAMNIQPDSSTAAALVRLHFATGQADTAVRVVADICQARGIPYAVFRDLGFVFPDSPHPFILPSSIPPSTEIFNALLQGILHTRGLNGMRAVQRVMRKLCIKFDETTLEIFLSYLQKTRRARPRELVRLLRYLWCADVTPTLQHVHIILRAILRRERSLLRVGGWNAPSRDIIARRVQALFSSGRLSGVAKSLDPTAGIKLPRAMQYRALIRPLLDFLNARQVRSDRATFALRIKHDAVVKGDLPMAKATFQAMVDRGMHPNQYHYSALMEGYAEAGDQRVAAEIMEAAKKMGVAPNVAMFTILLNGHARHGNPTQAARVFHNMVAVGIQPDVIAILSLVRAFHRARAYKAARRVLLQLWQTIAPFPMELRFAPLKQLVERFETLGRRNLDVPERLSKRDQRMLRWKIQRIASGWKLPDSRRKRQGTKKHHVSHRKTNSMSI